MVLTGLYLAAAAHVALVVRARRRTGRWDRAAVLAWWSGIGVLAVALLSALDGAGEDSLPAHMLQHVLLATVAPPLLLRGLPRALLAPVTARALRPVLRRRGGRRVLRRLAAPLNAFGVWAVLLGAWHLPALYERSLASPGLHVAQHLAFLTAGLAFWLPLSEVVPPLGRPFRWRARLGYLAAGQAVAASLAAVFLWAPVRVYGWYAGAGSFPGADPLASQRLAGAVMLGADMVVALTAAVWVVLSGLTTTDRAGRARLRA